MVQKQSNREFFEQPLNSHSEAFIICCLGTFLMFFGSIYRLLVSKSAAMNLSFLFRSSTLPHAAISCHVNTAEFTPRMLCPKMPDVAWTPTIKNCQQLACLSLTPMSPSTTFAMSHSPESLSVLSSSGASLCLLTGLDFSVCCFWRP
jgi:hypothetical protein